MTDLSAHTPMMLVYTGVFNEKPAFTRLETI